MSNYDYFLEYRLKEQNEELAQRHSSCMSMFDQMLNKFLVVFPTFTDHSLLHTLNITNITNQLLRNEILKLNASEIYIYLMACALHDIGMGVSGKDAEIFIDKIGIREYVNEHPEIPKSKLIRKFHNDFSAEFVKKYRMILEIPNERYACAIAEVGRGHRKTDLLDEILYPVDYDLGDGNSANLALLAAVIRLADELDIAADRNPDLLYDIENQAGMSKKDIIEFSKHDAIHALDFTEDEIVILAETDNNEIRGEIIDAFRTIVETFEYCLSVIEKRSDIVVGFKGMRLIINNQEVNG